MNMRLTSQSFLGVESEQVFSLATVGVVGLGGGGSHVAQQLAHVGIGHFVNVDFDIIEEKNLNRLVGGTMADVKALRLKVEIIERVILGINPEARVLSIATKWQEALEPLRGCDIIFGCVDSFTERAQLERFCRRFLVPYIDLGMDVHALADNGYSIGGQVALSLPDSPCLWCLGILNEARIAEEARRYGDAGSRPQVVWINGVLASLGIGIAIQLLAPWHSKLQHTLCCEFDGNLHRVETRRSDILSGHTCRHHPPSELGDAFFSLGRG